MVSGSRIAHFNVARLLHPPGDQRVAEFVDNTVRINEIAMRSKGYIWHLADDSALVTNPDYAGTAGDPRLAFSMSLWQSMEDFNSFVYKTAHNSFFRRRSEWFEPWTGPNYVIWNYLGEPPIGLEEGWARLKHFAANGATEKAYDVKFAKEHFSF